MIIKQISRDNQEKDLNSSNLRILEEIIDREDFNENGGLNLKTYSKIKFNEKLFENLK